MGCDVGRFHLALPGCSDTLGVFSAPVQPTGCWRTPPAGQLAYGRNGRERYGPCRLGKQRSAAPVADGDRFQQTRSAGSRDNEEVRT
jgi:hypothetical protein